MRCAMRTFPHLGYLGAFAVLALMQASHARADMLLGSATKLVSGSQSYTMQFVAPTSGIVTVQLTNLDWPVRLESLSMAATTATDLLQTLDTSEGDSVSFSV